MSGCHLIRLQKRRGFVNSKMRALSNPSVTFIIFIFIFIFFYLSNVSVFHLSDGVSRAETRQFGGTRPNFGPAKSVLTTAGRGSGRDILQGRRKQNCHGISGGQNPKFERCLFARICSRFAYIAPAPDRAMVVQSAQTGHALRSPGELKCRTMRHFSFRAEIRKPIGANERIWKCGYKPVPRQNSIRPVFSITSSGCLPFVPVM